MKKIIDTPILPSFPLRSSSDSIIQVKPEWLWKFSEVRQIWLGGCHFGGSVIETEIAHSHFLEGVMCIFKTKYWDIDIPSQTFLHEYAHLALKETHTSGWRKLFQSLLNTYHPNMNWIVVDGVHMGEQYCSEYD